MRTSIFAAAALAASLMMAPMASAKDDAAADSQIAAEEKFAQLTETLTDPETQDKIASMVEQMTGVMMQMPVGKFAAAIEDARPGAVKKKIPEDATIADLVGEKGENAPEMLGKQSRVAIGMMAGFANVFAEMLPEFQNMAKEFKAGLASE